MAPYPETQYVSKRRFMTDEEKKAHDKHLNKLRNQRSYLRKKEKAGLEGAYSEKYMERKELELLRLKYYALENAEQIQKRNIKAKSESRLLKKENLYLYKMVDVLQKELDDLLLEKATQDTDETDKTERTDRLKD